MTGCRPRGRTSARVAGCCCVWLVWPPSRRVLLQRVADRPLAYPTEEQSACRRARPSLSLPESPFSLLYGGACAGAGKNGLRALQTRTGATTLCVSAEGSAAARIRAMPYGSRGRKASRFHAIGPSEADSRLLTLNTCPLGKMLYVPGVASTPSSATSLIGRSFSAGLIGGLFLSRMRRA